MNNPNEVNDFWLNAKDLLQTIIPWLVSGWGVNKGINALFKYFSDSRDAELRKLIEKEVQPKFDELNDKMDKLQKSIWELNKNK